MKLNNTQIKTLAQEVLNRIVETKKEFTKEQLTKYTKIVNEYTKLENQIDSLIDKQKLLVDPIRKSGEFSLLYDNDFTDIKLLEKRFRTKNKKVTLEDIVHKITLETIFETKENMNVFINNLVKEYSK